MSWKRTKCSIISCQSKKKDFPERQFFLFPKPENKNYDPWLNAVGASKDFIKEKKKPYICSIHFENEYLGKKYLKQNAIPTLVLGASGSEEISTFDPSTVKSTYGCGEGNNDDFSMEDLNFAAKILPTSSTKDQFSEQNIFCERCIKSLKADKFYRSKIAKLSCIIKNLKIKMVNSQKQNQKLKFRMKRIKKNNLNLAEN